MLCGTVPWSPNRASGMESPMSFPYFPAILWYWFRSKSKRIKLSMPPGSTGVAFRDWVLTVQSTGSKAWIRSMLQWTVNYPGLRKQNPIGPCLSNDNSICVEGLLVQRAMSLAVASFAGLLIGASLIAALTTGFSSTIFMPGSLLLFSPRQHEEPQQVLRLYRELGQHYYQHGQQRPPLLDELVDKSFWLCVAQNQIDCRFFLLACSVLGPIILLISGASASDNTWDCWMGALSQCSHARLLPNIWSWNTIPILKNSARVRNKQGNTLADWLNLPITSAPIIQRCFAIGNKIYEDTMKGGVIDRYASLENASQVNEILWNWKAT